MKEIPVEDAVGHVLSHDITEIVKDKFKGARFKKGHIIKEEDIDVLKRIGKKNIYIFELEEGMIHENDAAIYLKDYCISENMRATEPSEGKIDIYAEVDGLLKVDIDRLFQVNSNSKMMIASRHNNMPVKKGDKILGTRIIPLVIEEEKMISKKVEIGNEPLFKLLPFPKQKAAIITTGSEVASGLIKDTFTPVVVAKLKKYNIEAISHVIIGDDKEIIEENIRKMQENEDIDMIICTGGMSVDPDDKTPAAISASADKMITYGTPVLPGAMFCLGYDEKTRPIVGLPGCVMYARSTIFDLILPRLAAKDLVTRDEIARVGHGGLCLECDICTYPECSFGKGA